MGLLLAICVGQIVIPVKGMPLILLSLYQAMDPTAVFPTMPYLIFAIVLTLLICATALLFMKFFLRVNLDVLKEAKVCNSTDNKFTKHEKYIFTIILSALILMVLQSSLPIPSITNFLGKFGMVGFCFVAIFAMLIIRINGKPLFTIGEMAHGVSWDIIFTVAVMQPVLGYLSSDDAGVSTMVSEICGPLATLLTPFTFVVFVLIVCGILTNVLNNQACCLIFYPILMVYAPQLGFSAVGLVSALIIVSHIAFATPAASVYSLIAFSYTDWIDTKFFMKWAVIVMIPTVIVTSILSFFLMNILF